MKASNELHTSATFTPEEKAFRVRCIGDLAGLRAGLEASSIGTFLACNGIRNTMGGSSGQ
jgi:hypothetical protein